MRRREDGFTLLEVMAAFVIAALASIVLYQAGFTGAGQSVTASRYQEAIVRAQSRLATIGTLTALRAMTAHGSDGGGFNWAMAIAPAASNGKGQTLYTVQIRESFGTRDVTLTTRMLGPST